MAQEKLYTSGIQVQCALQSKNNEQAMLHMPTQIKMLRETIFATESFNRLAPSSTWTFLTNALERLMAEYEKKTAAPPDVVAHQLRHFFSMSSCK